MTLAQTNSDYSVSRALTGDAVVLDLALSGWGNALATWSMGGCMFWLVSGSTITFYKRPVDGVQAATDRVCSGTFLNTQDPISLSALNTSGITGTVRATRTTATDSTGRAIISYGDELDLTSALQKATDLFDGTNTWRGVARFELAFRIAKQELDGWIRGDLRSRLPRSTRTNRLDLAMLANPRALARTHALLVGAVLMEWPGDLRPADVELAKEYRQRAREQFRAVELEIDDTDGGAVSLARPRVFTFMR